MHVHGVVGHVARESEEFLPKNGLFAVQPSRELHVRCTCTYRGTGKGEGHIRCPSCGVAFAVNKCMIRNVESA